MITDSALIDSAIDDKPTRKRSGRWSLNTRFDIGKPGNPMMQRWRLIQTPLFGIYVHFIYREDLDPVNHDHPWRFWSLVLRGGYTETYSADARNPADQQVIHRRRWRAHHFPLTACHRILHVQPRTATLVLVGRKARTWGFYDPQRGNAFVEWQDAINLRPTEGARSETTYPKAGS